MASLKPLGIFILIFGFLFVPVSGLNARPRNLPRKGSTLASQPKSVDPSSISYIETHMHLTGVYGSGPIKHRDFDTAAQNAMARMQMLHMKKMLIMPPPTRYNKDASTWYDYEELKTIAQKYPDRFRFLGGGGSLNPMIQEALIEKTLSPALKMRFEKKAHEIAKSGAVGFGEMTASHFSFREGHPYLEAPPDHPLFLLLADIAATYQMPIDLHMEAIEKDMPLPDGFQSPPNPKFLKANIGAFEKLLSHNRGAKIIWVHIGWDNTGQMNLALLRRLLKAHANLYMSLKVLDGGLSEAENRPTHNGRLKPAWLNLFNEFPDRFLLGADQFYGIPGKTKPFPQSDHGSIAILKGLPHDLVKKVAFENAEKLFNLAVKNPPSS